MSLSKSSNSCLPQVEKLVCRASRSPKFKKPEVELVANFWAAPLEALFSQETIAPVVQRSIKSLESDRWRGKGIPYRKCAGRVLYRKSDVVFWIDNHALVTSTSEYSKDVNHGQ